MLVNFAPYMCLLCLQGFTWAFLSGVSEPIGALLGYLVLNGNNDLSFAIVFGLVAGGGGANLVEWGGEW